MSDIPQPTTPPTAPSRTRRSIRLPEEIGVIGALVVMVVVIGIARPLFWNPVNLLTLFGNTVFHGIIALAMVYLLAIREIDLSVGWMFNFSAVIAATLMVNGVDPWIAALGGVLFGACLGLFNGLLVVGLNLPSIIVTLGTLSMYQGLSLVVSQSRSVNPTDESSSFFTFVTTRVEGIPMVAFIFVIAAIILHVVLHRTRFGYRVQAIGSNPEAARLAGIPVSRIRVQTMVMIGAICGLAGVLLIGYRGAVDTTSGQDFALKVVAAVIIGGTPLSGGRGTVIGALAGVIILAVITSGIIFFGIDQKWSTFVTGAVTVIAVTLDQIIKRQRSRRLQRGDD